jgi:hypothetical protein
MSVDLEAESSARDANKKGRRLVGRGPLAMRR